MDRPLLTQRRTPLRASSRWYPAVGVGLCVLLTTTAAYATAGATSAASTSATSDDARAATGALNLATHHYKAGRFKKAAGLYHEAFSIDAKPPYLFNAARAEMRAFDHATAKRDFARYIALPNATAKGRARARAHMQEIDAYQAKLAEQRGEAKTLAKAAATQARADATRPLDGMTLGLWVGTGVFLVGSGSLYGVAAILRAATNKMKVETMADKTRHNADVARENTIRNLSLVALVGAVGLGAWAGLRTRALRSPEPGVALQVAPWGDGRGLSLVGRF